VKSLDTETSCALQHGDVCGHFIASSNAFHVNALIHVTVLPEPSHWLTAHSQQDISEINLLCADQREGKMVVCHLKGTGATKVKSSITMAQPPAKMLTVAPILWLVGFQKAL